MQLRTPIKLTDEMSIWTLERRNDNASTQVTHGIAIHCCNCYTSYHHERGKWMADYNLRIDSHLADRIHEAAHTDDQSHAVAVVRELDGLLDSAWHDTINNRIDRYIHWDDPVQRRGFSSHYNSGGTRNYGSGIEHDGRCPDCGGAPGNSGCATCDPDK